jgi:uncharacterized membrane protein YedE/YeeE
VPHFLTERWHWYVVGALLGAVAPLLLLAGNRQLGVSGNLRTICAALLPRDIAFFNYDWKKSGGWNLAFALGILVGGFIGGVLLNSHEPIAIPPKKLGRGYRYWIGGSIFGVGLRLTGACPGPLLSLIGGGYYIMIVVLLSAIAGSWVYGYLRPHLPH